MSNPNPQPTGPVWLRGRIDGVPALLQPVAHALIEANEDVQALLGSVSTDILWERPGGAAAAGFHVRHAVGSLDRLLTYARGAELDDAQRLTLAHEKTLDRRAGDASELAAQFASATARALEQLRGTSEEELLRPREVGRAKLPSNVLGILVHAGDHTYRHVGQAITTVKILRGTI